MQGFDVAAIGYNVLSIARMCFLRRTGSPHTNVKRVRMLPTNDKSADRQE